MRNNHKGIALLLVILLLGSFVSISLGIFNTVFEELNISGEIGDSFKAAYAADRGVERTLFRDRITTPPATSPPLSACPNIDPSLCTETVTFPATQGGCYTMTLTRTGPDTLINVFGTYPCTASPKRIVRRAYSVSY